MEARQACGSSGVSRNNSRVMKGFEVTELRPVEVLPLALCFVLEERRE